MSVKQKFARSASWMVVGTTFNQISTFVVFIVLSRILSPAQFGLVAFATLFIDLSRPIITTGVPDALVRAPVWSQVYSSTAFWLNAVLAILVLIAIILIGIPVVAWTGHWDTFPFLVALSATLFIESLASVPTAILRRDFRYRELTVRTAISSIVSGAVGISCAFYGWGAWALVAQRTISTTVGLFFIWHSVKWIPDFTFDRKLGREIWKFASGLIGAQMLSNLNGQIAGLVVGIGLGPTSLALYRAGNRILLMVTQLTIAPIQRVALTAFSHVNERGGIPEVYKRLTGASAIIACPAFVGIGALSFDLIKFLFGAKWIASGGVMMASSLVVGVQVINYFFTPSLAAKGNTRGPVYYFASAIVGNAFLGLLAVPFGLMAVVLSQTVRGYIGLPISLIILKREIGLRPKEILAETWPPFLSACLMGGGLIVLRKWAIPDFSSFAALLILIPTGMVFYFLLLLVFARSSFRRNVLELRPLMPPTIARIIGRWI